MTNKIYTWLTCCLVAMLTTFSLTAKADTYTVNADAGSGTTYVPVYGSYVDTRNTHTQVLYLASDLGDIAAGDTITALKFFISSSASVDWGATLSFKLAETDETSLASAYITLDNPVEVYNGSSLSGKGTEMTIPFSTSYIYQGGNLVLDGIVVSTGTWKSATFVASIASGMARYNSGSGAGTALGYQPKMEVTYSPLVTSCPAPKNLAVASTTTTTATFTWAAGGTETSWNVAAYDGETKLDSAHVTAPTWTLATGLSASSTKTITLKVYNDCGTDGVNVKSSNLSVTTQCGAINMLPYVQNFDGADVPNCWTLHQNASNNPKIYSTSYYSHTGGYVLNFSGKSDTCIAVLPELAADANTTMITLWEYSSTGDSYANIQVGVMNDPADVTTFVPVASLPKSSSSIQQVVYLADAPAGYKYIAFRYTGGTSSYGSAYIDDITIDVLPSCIPVSGLTVSDITANGATISWTAGSSDQNAWKIKFTPAEGAAIEEEVTTNPATITSLAENTIYSVEVYANCNGDYSAACDPVSFSTSVAPASLPYATGFEASDDCKWVFVNGTNTNQWIIGSAEKKTGESSLYVSNDGSSYAYTLNAQGYVWAYRPINFAEEGQYSISFDWICGGESSYDGMTAYLMPASFSPVSVAGSSSTTFGGLTFSTSSPTIETATAAKVIVLTKAETDTKSWFNDQTSWANKEFTVNITARGTYILCFGWYNDTSSGSTPAGVDNISVAAKACNDVTNIAAESLTTNEVTLTWDAVDGASYQVLIMHADSAFDAVAAADAAETVTAATFTKSNLVPATSYKAYVRAACSESAVGMWVGYEFVTLCETIGTLPWREDFENAPSASGVLPTCWAYLEDNQSYPYVYNYSSSAYKGSKCLYFYGGGSSERNVVLPEITADLSNARIRFYYKSSESASHGQLILGRMSDPADATTFVGLDTLAKTDSYTLYEKELNMQGDHFIVLRYAMGTSVYGSAYVDNIIVDEIPTCFPASNLRVVDSLATLNSVQLQWSPNSDETSWRIVVKNGETELANQVVTDTIFTVNSLEASKSYPLNVAVYVRCGDVEAEALEATLIAATLCAEINELPWAEDFNSLTAGIPNCWDNSEGTTSSASYKWSYYATGHSGACVRFNSYNNSNGYTNTLATPEIVLPANPAELIFWCKNPAGGDFNVTIAVDGALQTTPLLSGLTSISSWTEKEVDLSEYAGHRIQIFFNGVSNYGYSDAYLYLDDVTVKLQPACRKPGEVKLTNITTSSASFNWSGNADNYSVTVYNGVTKLDSVVVAAADLPFVIDTLQENTAYTFNFKIHGMCGEEDGNSAERITSLSIKTPCGMYTAADLPIEEDFEAVTTGSVPDCWLIINPSAANHYIKVEEDDDTYMQAHNGDKCLGFNGGISAQYAILPGLSEDLSGLRLKFNYRNGYDEYEESYYYGGDWYFRSAAGDAYGTLTVGVMSNPGDAETFVEIQRLDKVTSFTDAEISFDNAPATHHYIAIRYAGGTSAGYVSVDDLVLEAQPACRHALDAQISNIGLTTATLSWTAPTTGGYKVLLKDGETELFNDSVTTTSVQLEQLESGHIYSGLALTITTFCDAENSSEVYAATLSFTTNCDVVIGDTIRFNFEGEAYPTGKIADNLPCWGTFVSKGTPSSSSYWAISTTPHEGAKSAYLYANSSDSVAQVLVSPIMNIPANGYEMLAYLKESSANENDSVNFYINTVPSLEGATHIGYIKPTEDWTLFRANLGARDQLYLLIEAYAFRSIYIDDIVLQPAPQCYPVQDISYKDLTAESVTITWQHAEGQSAWTVAVEDEDGVEYSEGTMEGASYLIEGLSANTNYVLNVTVTAQCDGDAESEPFTKQIAFHTPLSDDMIAIIEEDATVAIDLSDEDEQDSWALLGNHTNKFMFGEADDAPALFISDDQESWHYTVTSASAAIAYRQFRVVADTAKINVSFQWQANAETSNWDYGRAFIVPVNTECSFSETSPVIGSTTITATSVPTNGTSLVGAMYNKTSWQSADKDVTLAAGDYLLVFTWYNDGSEGNQYPLAVKNIVISDITNLCDKPSSLLKGATTSTSVTFSWTAGTNGASSFEVVAVVNGVERTAQIVDAPNFTIDDLVPNTAYTIALSVSGICENEEHTMALTGSYTFRTPRPEDFDQTTAETIGRESLFEIDLSSADEQAKWVALGSNANAFVIGNVEAGTPGIYISNDNSTWAYTVNSTSQAMIYRTFRINDDNTEVRVTFDWQAKGELLSSTAYDYGRAFVAAESVTPNVTSSNMSLGSTTISNTAINAEGIFSLTPNDAICLVGVTSWQTLTQTITLNAGLYRLLFTWKNDSSSGTQKPLGVKNISIENLKENESGTALDTNTLNSEVVKFILDNQVYIQRDGAVYDIFGRKVK